jgi:chromate transporter
VPEEVVVAREAAAVSPTLRQLAAVFLKVGATGFGGPMPMLAMIQSEIVQRRRWVTQEEFSEAVVVGQMLPGPVVINAMAYTGHRLRGWPGAIVVATSFILPSFLLMLALTELYFRLGQMPQLAGALRGLGSAVAALIAAAVWRMGKPFVGDPRQVVLLLGAMVALLLQANVVLVVLAAGLLGLAIYRGKPPPAVGPRQRPAGQLKL